MVLLKRLLFNLSNSAKILPALSTGRLLSVLADNATSTEAQRVVFNGPNELLESEIADVPEIEEGEILGKVRAATICGSDLHTIIGRRQEPVPRYIKIFILCIVLWDVNKRAIAILNQGDLMVF